MGFLNLLLQPTGFWQNIVLGLETVVKDYGLALILITLIIKLIMTPFDLFNKVIVLYNTRKQAKLKPALDKIKKTYESNPSMQNQKTQELYKREGFSMVGTCFGMLFTMVLSSVVFITLFQGMTSIANFKQIDQYQTLSNTYYQTVVQVNEDKNYGYNFQADNINGLNDFIDQLEIMTETEREDFTTTAQNAVSIQYGEIKSSFLWIKNIWKQDTTTNAILSYKEFSKVAKDLVKTDNENYVSQVQYDTVMGIVNENYGGPNGLFLLAVISIITSYLSVKIPAIISKRKAEKQGKVIPPQQGGNAIQFALPVVFGFFTFLYTAAFGIYIVAGAVFSLLTSPLITIVSEAIDEKREKRENEKNKVSYSRK